MVKLFSAAWVKSPERGNHGRKGHWKNQVEELSRPSKNSIQTNLSCFAGKQERGSAHPPVLILKKEDGMKKEIN